MISAFVSPFGTRLNAYYEMGDKDGDGVPDIQTVAYEDTLGYWTGPGGIRFHDDGTEVKEGDQWTLEGAWRAYGSTLDDWVRDVLALCTVAPNQHQLDALTLLAWNIGIANFAASTVLSKHNEGRFEEAAGAFGMWIYGTQQVSSGVEGPDGEPLSYPWKRALRGLLRRHYAEACLYLGYDWVEATASDRIRLNVRKTIFQEERGRWFDVVGSKTKWSEVLEVARLHPLSPETLQPTEIDPIPDMPHREPSVMADVLPEVEGLPPVLEPIAPPAETKPPSIHTRRPEEVEYGIDPDAGLKRMEETERYAGQFLVTLGVLLRANASRLNQAGGVLGILSATVLAMLDNPVTTALLTSVGVFVVGGALWLIGRFTERQGERVRERGREAASQGMY